MSLVLVGTVRAVPTELVAELAGDAEAPGPGDPDGEGFASVSLDPETGEVCYFIGYEGIGTPTAAHIHAGAAGAAGPPIVTFALTVTPDGFLEDCIADQDSSVLEAIIADPAEYYVNVHTADFPDGAIRGQLGEPPVTLFAELAGAAEVPGPGDPDGGGISEVSFLLPDEVCYFIGYGGIDTPTAAHIHIGAAGVAGPPVVTLDVSGATDEFVESCVGGLDGAVLETIIADPTAYYVNVHTAEFPDGAIRGQLATEPPPPPTCPAGELCNGLVGPGSYRYSGFAAAMTFMTDQDWFAFVAPDGFGLNSVNAPGAFYAFEIPSAVYTGSCGSGTGTIAQTPQAFVDHLTSHPNITVGAAPQAVSIGGASGLVLEVTGADAAECPGGIARVFTGEVADDEPPEAGDFVIADGEHIRFWALTVNGQAIFLAVDAFEGEAYAVLLVEAQSILDSVTFAISGGPAQPTPSPTPAALPDTAVSASAPTHLSSAALLLVALSGLTTLVVARRGARKR